MLVASMAAGVLGGCGNGEAADTSSATIKVDPHAAEQLKSAVSPMSIRMAITIIATVPILIVYPFLQRYFVGGMTIGAVKD